ncbi:hypothetical protein GCM10022243_67210 [Saccharothrix violaceirubra]|uniref:Uncharacterized protein n=1 Tax=Saccharothrix violaceirubra TaxID=413306 RepID=A0A7W7WW94_9PSEU|nr:hypothetical protein [Saccharothrix violaceirubra]MBB4965328.1 hypothetical protein [Saccharothrix violaceirubra]
MAPGFGANTAAVKETAHELARIGVDVGDAVRGMGQPEVAEEVRESLRRFLERTSMASTRAGRQVVLAARRFRAVADELADLDASLAGDVPTENQR